MCEVGNFILTHSLHSRLSSVFTFIFASLQSVRIKSLTFSSLYNLEDTIISYTWFKLDNLLSQHLL